ncbi:MAG: hypothetical protein JJT94_09660 [Bernardetiaceae bacterium]|nr:hypothetical protein [Bernardetiaceae bacterium]
MRVKRFEAAFESRLYQKVKVMEEDSEAEIVILVCEKSASYRETNLVLGLISLGFSILVWAVSEPLLSSLWLLIFCPLSFMVGYGLGFISFVKRQCTPEYQLQKMPETVARAVYQKANITNTKSRMGLLIYVSWLEQKVWILADEGLRKALSPQTLKKLHEDFNLIFTQEEPHERILQILDILHNTLAAQVPNIGNKENEIPNRISHLL